MIAPLNWGLGHATRCIPIVRALLEHGYIPILASDGSALALLEKEFPQLESVELPSYKINYAKKGSNFKLKMIWDSPKMIKAIAKEKRKTKVFVAELALDGIISDNRLGVYSKKVPCVFITHQLNVLTGNTSWMSSKVHQKIIRKFTACWVPDVEDKPNLSGKLGHLKKKLPNVTYIGPLSRFEKTILPKSYDLMVLLSGPEPQRSFLEKRLLTELEDYSGRVLFVKGVMEQQQKTKTTIMRKAIITQYNYMKTSELQQAFGESKLVISRSGYTTIMDLAKMEKKAFFIPTPGQYEQGYLAKRLQRKGMVPYCKQEDFKMELLDGLDAYTGLKNFGKVVPYSVLFSAFSRVKENSEPTPTSLST